MEISPLSIGSLSEEERKRVVELYNMGKSPQKIADIFKVSRTQINTVLKKSDDVTRQSKIGAPPIELNRYTKEDILATCEKHDWVMKKVIAELEIGAFLFDRYINHFNITIKKKDFPVITKEELYQLHIIEKKSSPVIAKIYSISSSSVNKLLKKYNIINQCYRSVRRLSPEKDELVSMCAQETFMRVCEYYKCDVGTLKRWMKENNISQCKQYDRSKSPTAFIEDILRLHFDEKNTIENTGRILGIGDKRARKILWENGYETKLHRISQGERELKKFFEENNIDMVKTRKMLNGRKEIDFFNEERRIGVEFNGVYHHSDALMPARNLYQKYTEATKNGITLFSIYETEWYEKRQIVESVLLSKFNKYDRRIGSRKCEFVQLNKKDAKKFLNDNHIQGSSSIKYAFGLMFEEELLGVITFGAHHRQKHSNTIVLNRLCFLKNTQVIGGASKLFKNALRYLPNMKIITWSDNRWSNGDIYESLGFTLEADLPPDYMYVKQLKLLPKQNFQKKKINCPVDMTEREYCKNVLGLHRIYDCGKKRWTYEREQ